MKIFERTVTLGMLAAREIELVNRKRSLKDRLSELENNAATALAETDAPSELDAVIRARTELNSIDAAIGVIRGRRPAICETARGEKLAEIRRQIKKKSGELATLMEKTQKLLRELSTLQGVNYTEGILRLEPTSNDGVFGCQTAKFETLQAEILTLEQQIFQIESSPAYLSVGSVDIEGELSTAEILSAALQQSSNGPTAESLIQWLDTCADDDRLPGRSFDGFARRVRIQWRAGEIDEHGSYVFVKELAKKNHEVRGLPLDNVVSKLTCGASFDLSTATFKAKVPESRVRSRFAPVTA